MRSVSSASPTAKETTLRIDGLATALLTTLFDSGSVFFFRTTPPTNERSSGGFAATRGSQFPSLPPEFFSDNPGRQFQGLRNFADLIVVAMGVGIDGNVEIKKTSIGDIEVVTGNLQPLFPIITQVDIRSSLNNNNQLFCADVHLGNIAQGLNMAAFRDHVSGLVPGTVGDCRAQIIDIPGFGTGSAGAANNVIAGLQLQTRNNEFLTPAQVQFNVRWNNVPLFSDDDLGGLFTSQFSRPDGF